MNIKSYYRNIGKPFVAKKHGYCLSCKKDINIGDIICVIFFTKGKMPFHWNCKSPTEKAENHAFH